MSCYWMETLWSAADDLAVWLAVSGLFLNQQKKPKED